MTLTNPHTKESVRIHIGDDGILLFDLRYHFSGLYMTRDNINFIQENAKWIEESYLESSLHGWHIFELDIPGLTVFLAYRDYVDHPTNSNREEIRVFDEWKLFFHALQIAAKLLLK